MQAPFLEPVVDMNRMLTRSWLRFLQPRRGTTAKRPVLSIDDAGYDYFDTDIKKIIVWTGAAWDIPYDGPATQVSSEQSIAQIITFAHGLGVIPNLVRVIGRCKTAEFGYSVNDEIDVTFGGYSTNFSYFTAANATNITWVMVNPGVFRYIKKDDAAVISDLTAANWKIVITAWKFT